MKKLFILSSLLFLFNFCISQPQWKFHIAFEDATGAKDTIWLIWDTTATGNINGYDTLLGEGPFNFDYNQFNVWTTNDLGDTTKTVALPYNAISFMPYVYGFNHQYPITITWDTSLFHAPYLPFPIGYINAANIDNDYFFGVNNNFPFHYYNMLIDNNVIAPEFFWGSQSQFPMIFYIAKDPSLDINENYIEDLNAHPNPFENILTISTTDEISVEIYSIMGKLLISEERIKDTRIFDLSHLAKGIYIIKCHIEKKHTYYEKIIKIR